MGFFPIRSITTPGSMTIAFISHIPIWEWTWWLASLLFAGIRLIPGKETFSLRSFVLLIYTCIVEIRRRWSCACLFVGELWSVSTVWLIRTRGISKRIIIIFPLPWYIRRSTPHLSGTIIPSCSWERGWAWWPRCIITRVPSSAPRRICMLEWRETWSFPTRKLISMSSVFMIDRPRPLDFPIILATLFGIWQDLVRFIDNLELFCPILFFICVPIGMVYQGCKSISPCTRATLQDKNNLLLT